MSSFYDLQGMVRFDTQEIPEPGGMVLNIYSRLKYIEPIDKQSHIGLTNILNLGCRLDTVHEKKEQLCL